MADEIGITVQVNYQNGLLKETFNPGKVSVDQATQGFLKQVVEVGTAEEDMPAGDIDTDGILILYNLDLTNFVTYGPDAADSSGTGGVAEFLGKLSPGDPPTVMRLIPGKQLRWKADTASCRVLMILFEH